MTGIQANLIYDQCASVQELAQSTRQFRDYDFVIEKYENRKATNTVATCDGRFAHVECKSCTSNEGVMDNTRKASLEYRLNVESDLFGLTRPYTLCDSGKYMPCNMDPTGKNSCAQNKPIAEPLLCDRAICPTNMRPFTGPFSY